MKSLVSVIIPAYNAEKFIEEAIKSAQNQTYKNIEIIVVDDGSTDGTAEIVKKLAKKDKRIRYHHQKNKGVSIARNTAINYSKGQFIALLDQDDIWLPEKIKEQMETLRAEKKSAEMQARESSPSDSQKLEDLETEIKANEELMSDLAFNLLMENKTVELTDEYHNRYTPHFVVKFKKEDAVS